MITLSRYFVSVLVGSVLLAGCGGSISPSSATAVPMGYGAGVRGAVNSLTVYPTVSSPTITHVTQMSTQQTQQIVIRGTGFGTMAPYNGDSCCILVVVSNFGCPGGDVWAAGQTGDPVTLNVTKWRPDKIIIAGFTGDYGQGCQFLARNDTVNIRVYNAQTQEGPATWNETLH